MVKRQKWTEEEDEVLQKLVAKNDSDTKWDLIAYQMEQISHKKTAKQCRERLSKKVDAPAEP